MLSLRDRTRRRRSALLTRVLPAVVGIATTAVVSATLTGGGTSGAATYPNPGTVTGSTGIHDPSMVKGTDGVYYAFGTGSGIPMKTSTDRTSFASAGQALPNGATWSSAYHSDLKDIWAPDISYHNGKYLLYYAVSSFGSNKSAIGVAGSTTAKAGSWTDYGLVFATSSSNSYNAIDPNLVVDSSGKWWLTFGSWWTGIKQIQIDPSTGKQLSTNKTVYSVASRTSTSLGIEAGFVFKHGSYYYLFTSWDICCQGVNSTYNIRVGRSTSINGTYKDKSGVALTSGGGTLLLASHGTIIGPGGQSILADTDHDLLVYHYYDGADNGNPKLGINWLLWDSSDWPYVG